MQLPADLPPHLHTIALYLDARGHRRIDILDCLLCVSTQGTAEKCEYLTLLERETVDALIPPADAAEWEAYDDSTWSSSIPTLGA